MAWKSFNLDKEAHNLVLKRQSLNIDNQKKKEVFNQAHTMRLTVAYGLERFWGEQIRLKGTPKGDYWRDTWKTLCKIMERAGIKLPNDDVRDEKDKKKIKEISEQLWELDNKQRKVALAILTQLCDSMVWWTQRYKKLVDD
ncbi:MAG: hypothetical protein QNJ55_22940 [Xenococcus sp. MO_188.B8]|nr:hypothetical protein [Xenococcus sp. MO_188.B8]